MSKNNGWNKLSDCAPDVGQTVLVYIVDSDGVKIYGRCKLACRRKTMAVKEPERPARDCWQIEDNTFAYNVVRYWMSLPEPPCVDVLEEYKNIGNYILNYAKK